MLSLYNFFQCDFSSNYHLTGFGMPTRFREIIVGQILIAAFQIDSTLLNSLLEAFV